MRVVFFLILLFAFNSTYAQKIETIRVVHARWLTLNALVQSDVHGVVMDTTYMLCGVDSRLNLVYKRFSMDDKIATLVLHKGKLSDILAFLMSGNTLLETAKVGTCIDKNGNRLCIGRIHSRRHLVLYGFNQIENYSTDYAHMSIEDDTLEWFRNAILKWAKKQKVTIH